MKPSRMQYIFAKEWPMRAYFALAAVFGLWIVLAVSQPSAAMFRDWQFVNVRDLSAL